MMTYDLDQLVENQLNLQVKISYGDHYDFLLRHGLSLCGRLLDVGTGNGSFVARLAQDHPQSKFTGIDKRKYCIDSCQKIELPNLDFAQVDMFSRTTTFDFSVFDGILMRYFLLHVDHSRKVLELLKQKAKRPSRLWIIDLDFSQFRCEPSHPSFDKLTRVVKDFCQKTSVDSLAGQRILPLLQEFGFQDIQVENTPFSPQTISHHDLALYIKQEVLCYSIMSGKSPDDAEVSEILNFLELEVKSGKVQVSYGMILLSALLPV